MCTRACLPPFTPHPPNTLAIETDGFAHLGSLSELVDAALSPIATKQLAAQAPDMMLLCYITQFCCSITQCPPPVCMAGVMGYSLPQNVVQGVDTRYLSKCVYAISQSAMLLHQSAPP